ncbi:uncharacterized protein LOC126986426 isoform X2 [Eriocheir sinensis]|uniref:uncharacterized protein LOC126986426 isoform X2 n=1 Tax=Eriocheir sinensis TaxID=95602 RepID=UPI0021C8E394|nr:uncharacterized protein LOC126986426 isoform X2 [Eriocheir sinensis]
MEEKATASPPPLPSSPPPPPPLPPLPPPPPPSISAAGPPESKHFSSSESEEKTTPLKTSEARHTHTQTSRETGTEGKGGPVNFGTHRRRQIRSTHTTRHKKWKRRNGSEAETAPPPPPPPPPPRPPQRRRAKTTETKRGKTATRTGTTKVTNKNGSIGNKKITEGRQGEVQQPPYKLWSLPNMLTLLLALLYLALLFTGQEVLLMDILWWCESGRIPFPSAHFTVNTVLRSHVARCPVFVKVPKVPSSAAVRRAACHLALALSLQAVPFPSAGQIIKRLVDVLRLPEDTTRMSEEIASKRLLLPQKHGLSEEGLRKGEVPAVECQAAAALLVTLKILCGLNDSSEHHLSVVAARVNGGGKGGGGGGGDLKAHPLFSFDEWMRFIVEVGWLSRQVDPLGKVISPHPVLSRPWELKLMGDLNRLLTFCCGDPAVSLPDLTKHPNLKRRLEVLGLSLEGLCQAHFRGSVPPYDPLLGTLEKYVSWHSSSSSPATSHHRWHQAASSRFLLRARQLLQTTFASTQLFWPHRLHLIQHQLREQGSSIRLRAVKYPHSLCPRPAKPREGMRYQGRGRRNACKSGTERNEKVNSYQMEAKRNEGMRRQGEERRKTNVVERKRSAQSHSLYSQVSSKLEKRGMSQIRASPHSSQDPSELERRQEGELQKRLSPHPSSQNSLKLERRRGVSQTLPSQSHSTQDSSELKRGQRGRSQIKLFPLPHSLDSLQQEDKMQDQGRNRRHAHNQGMNTHATAVGTHKTPRTMRPAVVVVVVMMMVVMVVESTAGVSRQRSFKAKERAGDEDYHRKRKQQYKKEKKGSSYDTVPFIDLEDQAYWNRLGQEALAKQLEVRPVVRRAKNVVLFLGDGMSLSTVTAARILKGQRSGLWEHEAMVWEDFPYSAIIKTYTTDSQVADSAASANAYLSGVKTNKGTLGVDMNVDQGNCSAQLNQGFHLSSLAQWFQDSGRSAGFVTTTRVTHATPAGVYAHVADREWEDDDEVRRDGEDPDTCDDIAEQLVLGQPGKNLKVVMGGGRRNLLPKTVRDVVENKKGYRNDGKNLIEMWQQQKAAAGAKAAYVWNRNDLLAVDTSRTDYLLGLFGYSHMDYSLERDRTQDPSLPEMTKAAIEILQKDPGGYFLLVEGGLIDLAHHGNKGRKALTETLEMDEAVQVVLSMVDLTETLVVVTADHGHALTINGYPSRHTDILGVAERSSKDYLPYTTLLYGNGPGYRVHTPGHRPDPTRQDMADVDYRQDAAVPLSPAAHSGDDVGLWATGPHAHLFTGVYEQNYIAHALAYAACVGHGRTFCRTNNSGARRNRGTGVVAACRGARRWRQQC